MAWPFGDERGTQRTAINTAQNRYEGQQGPFMALAGENYGRGSEADYGNYMDIMNRYRGFLDGSSGGGVGGAGYSPAFASYNDPFNSYGGFQEFSKTGGYSPEDIANMRARGVSPIRSAYASAQQNVQRQRSLQGGYAPNAIATQAKMAREQGQSMADATQNVEAGLAEARNKGRLAGLQGMFGVEGQRLGADVDISKFNAGAQNAASAFGASASNAASAANARNQLGALSGMTSLYGTTPGMTNTTGNQYLTGMGQGGQMSLGYLGARQQAASQLPGKWDSMMNRVGQVANMAFPWMDYFGFGQGTTGAGAAASGGYNGDNPFF